LCTPAVRHKHLTQFTPAHVALLFFFHHPAPPQIYTFPYTTLFRSCASCVLNDSAASHSSTVASGIVFRIARMQRFTPCTIRLSRSEEHTSELQSLAYLVCRLLLEKKKKTIFHIVTTTTSRWCPTSN